MRIVGNISNRKFWIYFMDAPLFNKRLGLLVIFQIVNFKFILWMLHSSRKNNLFQIILNLFYGCSIVQEKMRIVSNISNHFNGCSMVHSYFQMRIVDNIQNKKIDYYFVYVLYIIIK